MGKFRCVVKSPLSRSFGIFRARQALAGLLLLLGSVATSEAALPLAVDGQPLPSLAPMLDRATPAVANIATRGPVRAPQSALFNDPFFRRFFNVPEKRRENQSLGSGVIVDAERGLLLTNHHVVKGAAEITVTLRDGRQFEAELVGSDPESDVAVLRVQATGLVAIPIANSSAARVGDFVVAIGNPFGLGQTVTSGIVSALGRRGLGLEGYEDFIQTDASINVGNSGGALVNLRGELLGINTAILAPGGGSVGIGFAIPSNMAVSIMRDLVQHGRVRRGLLGIAAQDLTPQLAEAFGLTRRQGAVIVRVKEDSPAARAGLQPGDVVTAVNGRTVKNASDLGNAIGLARVGESVRLDIVREGQRLELTAELVDRAAPSVGGEQLHPRLAGVTLGEVVVRSRNGEHRGGVQVTEVEPGSPGWRIGLRPGDYISAANRRPIATVEELALTIEAARGRLMLAVQRGDSGLFVLVE